MNYKRIIATVLCVCPLAAQALSSDSQKPMHVAADTAELNEKTGVSVYRGDVRVTQGSMVLIADTITVTAPRREIEKIVAEGDLASFRQLTDDGREIHAWAEHMEYRPDEDVILLLRNARLEEGGDTFASDRIRYHVTKEVVDAGGPGGGDRVKMTIVPEPNAQETDNKSAEDFNKNQ